MQEMLGDRFHADSTVVGASDQTSEIIDVRERAERLPAWCAPRGQA